MAKPERPVVLALYRSLLAYARSASLRHAWTHVVPPSYKGEKVTPSSCCPVCLCKKLVVLEIDFQADDALFGNCCIEILGFPVTAEPGGTVGLLASLKLCRLVDFEMQGGVCI